MTSPLIADAALEDELLTTAARAQAGVGQHFLEPVVLARRRRGRPRSARLATRRGGRALRPRLPGLPPIAVAGRTRLPRVLTPGRDARDLAACLTPALPGERSGVET